jgi:hypothetical protein
MSVALAAAVVSMLMVLPVVAAEGAAPAPKPLEVTLERLAEMLTRLDAQLGAVDRPAAHRLEERAEEAAQLVENLLTALEDPNKDASPREKAARLNAALHRLVALLEEIVGRPEQRPEQAEARMTFDELRAWADGYITAVTAGMPPREAARFERAAQELARELVAQLMRVAKKAPEPGAVKLPEVIARLEALTARLDELLLRQAAKAEPAASP